MSEPKPSLRQCIDAVMAHQWSNTRAAMDALTTLLDVASEAADELEICPHCRSPAPGWSSADLRRGWRMEGTTKHYHCREAAVED